MTQPKFAPILPNGEVREVYQLDPPAPWWMHRPGDFRADPAAHRGKGRGSAGPDQGYALLLAERYVDRLRLADGEHVADVLAGVTVVATRRAALFGRAPVAADLELALHLFGFLDGGSEEMVETRRRLFAGVSHGYWVGRELADAVPESTLRLTPAEVSSRLAEDREHFAELLGEAA